MGEARQPGRSAETIPAWAVCGVLLVLAAAGSMVYLLPAWEEFPMDDTYIHLVYAENLAERGDLFFNAPGEPGIGTSSILWTLLLAAGRAIGLPMGLLAKSLGVLSLAVAAAVVYLLLRPVWRFWRSIACALLVALSGNMLWFALCGMETTLFLALMLLAILAYRGRRWCLAGLLLGLGTLARTEGGLLLVAIAGIDVLRRRKIEQGLLVAGVVWFVLCAPWFGYLWWRTGHLLPTSGIGKHFTSQVSIQAVVESSSGLARLARLPGVVYAGAWLLVLLEFNLGGIALPGPRWMITPLPGGPAYPVSIWALALWAAAILPLVWAGMRRLLSGSAWRRWIEDPNRCVLLVLGAWALLHNVAYMIYLPIPGTASRYGVVNHLLLWMVLTAGLRTPGRRALPAIFFGASITAIALANLIYWNGVYDANLEHMQSVRIAAARFVRDRLSPLDRCAAFDIGAVRYHSQRPIVDLGGLIEPEAQSVFEAGAVDQYLLRRRVTCLIVPRPGARHEGWADILTLSGVTGSSMLATEELTSFEIDYDRWLQGYLATVNYQGEVAILRLIPVGE